MQELRIDAPRQRANPVPVLRESCICLPVFHSKHMSVLACDTRHDWNRESTSKETFSLVLVDRNHYLSGEQSLGTSTPMSCCRSRECVALMQLAKRLSQQFNFMWAMLENRQPVSRENICCILLGDRQSGGLHPHEPPAHFSRTP